MHTIAIAAELAHTAAGRAGPWFDDQQLQQALEARGHRVAIIGWESPTVDLLRFDAIFVSSTWNACVHPAAFTAWLDACERDGQRRLINDRAVIDAGFAKYRYWRLLERALQQSPAIAALGQLTPSRFYVAGDRAPDGVEALGGRALSDVLAASGGDLRWDQTDLVLKPAISADGINTFVYNRSGRGIPIDEAKQAQFVITDAPQAAATFLRLARDVARSGVLLQPYMAGVEAGEYSLTFLGRRCTHAIQKSGRFKAAEGRRRAIGLGQLPHTTLAFAEQLVGWLHDHFGDGSISRARVDLFDQDGVPTLCELECVEPSTNIKIVAQHDQAAAQAIVQTYARVIEARTAALLALRGLR